MVGLLFSGIWIASASAAFPGRNGRIVFVKAGEHSAIYSVNPDGSRLRRIRASEYNSKPSVAPDGRTIAFARPRKEGSAIFTVRMSGRHLTRLTAFGGSVEPSFSGPLGRRIAFTRFGVTSEIWLMASDGTDQRRLIDTPTGDRSPAFSPDGNWIAFDRSDQNREGQIYRVRSDGSDLRRLTRGKRSSGSPSFSPNGKSIVFDHATGNGNWAIEVMRANGTHRHRIALGEFPAFSPNGQRIAFSREMGAHEVIYTVDRHGHHLRRVTPRRWSASYPDWAPRAENG